MKSSHTGTNLSIKFTVLFLCAFVTPTTSILAETRHPFQLEKALHLTAPTPRTQLSQKPKTEKKRPSTLANVSSEKQSSETAEKNDSSDQWQGPGAELGYNYYNLATKRDKGAVHAFDLGGYFTGIGPIRFGGYFEFGYRDNKTVKNDYVLRFSGSLGYKHIWHLGRFVPFVNVVGGMGLAIGTNKRKFNLGDNTGEVNVNIPTLETFWTVGPEIGLDARLISRLWMGLSFSYQKINMKSFSSDAYMVRTRFGF